MKANVLNKGTGKPLNWGEDAQGLATAFELFNYSLPAEEANSLVLLHRASVYVECNKNTMQYIEFTQYFALVFKCLDDYMKNPKLRQKSNNLRCIEKADSVLCTLLYSNALIKDVRHNALFHPSIVGVRQRISAAKRIDIQTPFKPNL